MMQQLQQHVQQQAKQQEHIVAEADAHTKLVAQLWPLQDTLQRRAGVLYHIVTHITHQVLAKNMQHAQPVVLSVIFLTQPTVGTTER